MITHEELNKHLQNLGYTTSVSPLVPSFPKIAGEKVCVGQYDELGVALKWRQHEGQIWVSFRLRTGAGGDYGCYGKWSILRDLSIIDGYRGAPPKREQLSHNNLPKPYKFRQDRVIITESNFGNCGYTRTGVIFQATLVGIVGIQDNAKINVDMAAKPDEPVWFYFDCKGYAGATFNIITDGDIWYPINQKSQRITTQMKPKKSVDLTGMSIIDHEFLIAVIEDFASKM